MRYLGNNHVGFDPAALGFPSIKACQAVVYQTSFGLFGFHDMKGAGGAEVDKAKAQAFAQFVQENGINHGALGQRLYGVINQTEQYGTDQAGLADWSTMLLGVAKALAFKGPIFRHRIVTHVDKGDSVYVRFDLAGAGCRISWRRWSKMGFDTTQDIAKDHLQQQLGKTSAYGQAPVYGVKAPFEDIHPVKRVSRSTGQVRADEGTMHTVPDNAIQQMR